MKNLGIKVMNIALMVASVCAGPYIFGGTQKVYKGEQSGDRVVPSETYDMKRAVICVSVMALKQDVSRAISSLAPTEIRVPAVMKVGFLSGFFLNKQPVAQLCIGAGAVAYHVLSNSTVWDAMLNKVGTFAGNEVNQQLPSLLPHTKELRKTSCELSESQDNKATADVCNSVQQSAMSAMGSYALASLCGYALRSVISG